jgi:tRNA/tmRNA/rRNA uracil-C5-methylase (TrmA/RlmC/RlmD family)
VRGRAASPKLGLFQAGSHRIVDIPRCPIHHPRINDVAAAVRRGIRACGSAPYADAPHRGDLRYVQIAVERASDQAQVVLVGNADRPDALGPLLAFLQNDLGPALHSLWWNGNPERTNRILGPHWSRVAGPAALVEAVNGVAVHYPPGAFAQSHAALAEQLAAQVAAWVPERRRHYPILPHHGRPRRPPGHLQHAPQRPHHHPPRTLRPGNHPRRHRLLKQNPRRTPRPAKIPLCAPSRPSRITFSPSPPSL